MAKDPKVRPQTLIFSKGYDPQRSEGAAIPPVFRTSTFVFRNAAEGKRAFEIAYGLAPIRAGESPALIYTRVNNPNSEIVEDKATAWDGAEAAALFSSGMGAISSSCLAFLRPGDTLLFSDPVYGGTEYLFRHVLPSFGIATVPFPAGATEEELEALARKHPKTRVVYLESPANPTMLLCDVPAARRVADRHASDGRRTLVLVDNTFMGPLFLRPLGLGADLVLYSATKFFGGHSDLVAGFAMGSQELVGQVKVMRTILGSNSDPDTAWLIHRSLGTLQLRMEKQQEGARKLVDVLRRHPKVSRVLYPGLPEMGERQVALWKRTCSGTGSVVSFTLKDGDEATAFRVLDAVRHIRLAVSLGGIETLIEHPWSMTHSDMTPEEKRQAGIGEDMIRLSVGLEEPEDLASDLVQALDRA
ncbi:MAG TPA: aminotransferase class I/II-fold pyridoxal phosphate-dependent enzyme [Anaeromyxobacteraceae bacterium]|nr:aminotransferase class I/II-fold pyridoxal phosphate-dependent enzyme [Anaeromyxobacteraceae bacterium]